MPEKFLYELIDLVSGAVHSTFVMTEQDAKQSNEQLLKQSKRLEWRKKDWPKTEVLDLGGRF